MIKRACVFLFLGAAVTGLMIVSRSHLFEQDDFGRDFLSRLSQYETAGINNTSLREEKDLPSSVKVPILIYHSVGARGLSNTKNGREYNVDPAIFEKQLLYLKNNGYSIISFNNLIDYFSKNSVFPSKPIIITFDDGWKNQYVYAFPLLKKYNATATFFIFNNAVGHKNFMTWEELRDLAANGMTIGGHSKSHPYLYQITDEKKLREEIADSKKILENNLGGEVLLFAYPFGHYNDTLIKMLKEAGYKAARSTYKGLSHSEKSLFYLTGILVENDLEKFAKVLD